MKINHMIIGSSDVNASKSFYCEFLGFRETNENPGMEGGAVLEHDESELLVLPFTEEKLPNPFHFAFEVESKEEFDRLLQLAEDMNLEPRAMPGKNAKRGMGSLKRSDIMYNLFYVFDPCRVLVEVMVNVG